MGRRHDLDRGTTWGHVPLAPRCATCRRRHLADLPCWNNDYRRAIVRAVLEDAGAPYVCWLCGLAGSNSADHIRPRSRGGTDALDNLRPAHLKCNARRSDRDPFEPIPDRRPPVEVSTRYRIP